MGRDDPSFGIASHHGVRSMERAVLCWTKSEYQIDGDSLVGTANAYASALGVEVRVPAGAKLALVGRAIA